MSERTQVAIVGAGLAALFVSETNPRVLARRPPTVAAT